MKVFLKNYWIRTESQKDYYDDEYVFLTYVGLRIIQGKEVKNSYVVSVDRILEELFGNVRVSNEIRQKIIGSIDLLDISGKITILNSIGKQNNKWELDLKNLYIDSKKDKYYTIVEHSDIQKILRLSHKKRISIMRYYCVLVSTMLRKSKKDNTDVIGDNSLSFISSVYEISEPTQIRYSKILEENGLIYVRRMETLKRENNRIKTLNNIYGLPESRDKINRIAHNRIRPMGDDKTLIKQRPNANAMRSIKQKINKGVSLTEEEIQIISDENEHKDEVITFLQENDPRRKLVEDAKVDVNKLQRNMKLPIEIDTQNEVKYMQEYKDIKFDDDADVSVPDTVPKDIKHTVIYDIDKKYILKLFSEGYDMEQIAEKTNSLMGSKYSAEDIEEYLRQAS